MHYNVYMYNEQFKPFLYLVMSVIYNSSVNKCTCILYSDKISTF